jgi:geranylgeranyl pyrophosphate synthase
VREVNAHLAGMKGKMFRPTLVLLSSAADDRPEARAVPIAAALEALHLATLVHDDAVDHSVLRRGMPTVNALFSHQVAVLMGDFLYARALTELVRLNDWDVARIFADASTQMTVGEMRQLSALDALAFSEADYDQLIQAKTASLFRAACELGALCGAREHRAALARYGERLGMAFQVVDDLLDYTEDAEVTGKPSGLDLREHKVTLPLIAALPEFDSAARGARRGAVRRRRPRRPAGGRGDRPGRRARRARLRAPPRRRARPRGRGGARHPPRHAGSCRAARRDRLRDGPPGVSARRRSARHAPSGAAARGMHGSA